MKHSVEVRVVEKWETGETEVRRVVDGDSPGESAYETLGGVVGMTIGSHHENDDYSALAVLAYAVRGTDPCGDGGIETENDKIRDAMDAMHAAASAVVELLEEEV